MLASGPSLTQEQIEAARDNPGTVIATNSTIFDAPWADICFGMDHDWWQYNNHRVKQLGCEMLTTCQNATPYGPKLIKKIQGHYMSDKAVCGKNSGHIAIELAVLRGATEILLCGIDCKNTDKTHYFGDHDKRLNQIKDPSTWIEQFEGLARETKKRGIRAINCSPISAVEGFEKMTIQEAINGG